MPETPHKQQASFRYLISGLKVCSEVELLSAVRDEDASERADVAIRFGSVPESLHRWERQGSDWQIAGDEFLLHIHGVMRVLMKGGHAIVADLDPHLRPADSGIYLLGTCFAVILQQRGRVVLHASAVSVGDRAMLFCGQSGAGKSTMAALLTERGFPLLNDDVCNLHAESSGEFNVYPDGRMLKLWDASMRQLSLQGTEEARIRHDVSKYYAAAPRTDAQPRRVGGVYMLETIDPPARPSLHKLNAAEAMSELIQNTYRPALVNAMQMTPAYFAAAVSIQRSAGVFRLQRPMDFALAGQTLDLLQEHWSAMGSATAPVAYP